jgi:lysylphosphatidylglycerol synthetase-like protein (DUF2156 family)
MNVPASYWMIAFFAYFVGGILMAVHVIGVTLGLWGATAGTWWAALVFLLVLVILGAKQALDDA